MLTYNYTFKYETLYAGTFEIMKCGTNSTVTLQYDGIKIPYNVCHINIFTYNDHVEDISF